MNDQQKTAAPAKPGANDYSKTLYLPQTEFPMRAGLPQREPEILKRWDRDRPLRQAAPGVGRPRQIRAA